MSTFAAIFNGYLRNILKWEELSALWENLKAHQNVTWYIYQPGLEVPTSPVSHEKLSHFIDEIDALLRTEHDEDYCGIVYVDNIDAPSLIKIYDPNNLGSVCGSSGHPPPLPGWILSTMPPDDLSSQIPLPKNRQRWWQRIFG